MASALYFLLLKSTDSWSLLHSRHQDSTDPTDLMYGGKLKKILKKVPRVRNLIVIQQQAKTLELSLVSSKRWTAFAL